MPKIIPFGKRRGQRVEKAPVGWKPTAADMVSPLCGLGRREGVEKCPCRLETDVCGW
jgi:hypothetical protein